MSFTAESKEPARKESARLAREIISAVAAAAGDAAHDQVQNPCDLETESKLVQAKRRGVRDLAGWLADEYYNDVDFIVDLIGDHIYDAPDELHAEVLDELERMGHSAVKQAVKKLRRDESVSQLASAIVPGDSEGHREAKRGAGGGRDVPVGDVLAREGEVGHIPTIKIITAALTRVTKQQLERLALRRGRVDNPVALERAARLVVAKMQLEAGLVPKVTRQTDPLLDLYKEASRTEFPSLSRSTPTTLQAKTAVKKLRRDENVGQAAAEIIKRLLS